AAEICLANGALDVLISDTEDREDSIWKARGAFLEAIKAGTTDMDEADIVVPRSRVAEMMLYAHALQDEIGLRIKGFGHAGDGNVHIYLLRGDLAEEEWQCRLKVGMDRLYAKGRELEGRTSGEHGIGWAKREYLKRHSNLREIEIMRAVKRAFDPDMILNPGKVCW
ncbi:MAG: 2-hydroxy-acid oxidase, partial [Clostridiales bacterium]|nr:2-hydroxy-acid oxidase [Clostridiales bacterium]